MSYLKDIAVFVRVVENKGFAAAGRSLGLTAPSVSKQIARLETELGVALLHRTTHNLFLTDAGQEFFDRCVRGLATIEEARATALSFNEELRGTLRIHTTLCVGQALIAPALTDFLRANRGIAIDLEMSSVPINPMEHQIDIAIRTKTARETSPGHVSVGRRILGHVKQVVVAAPEYLARTGTPMSIDEMAARDCLVYFTHSTFSETWQFLEDGREVVIKVQPVLRSNNWLAIRHAACRGLGIARLPDFAVREELASGRLVSLFEDRIRSDQQVQALFPKSQRMPAKTRLLLDYLASSLATAGREQQAPAPSDATEVGPATADPKASSQSSAHQSSAQARRAPRQPQTNQPKSGQPKSGQPKSAPSTPPPRSRPA